MEPITFASLITPPGVVVAAGIVTALVQLIKGVFPVIDEKVSGALQAFVLTAILYVLVAITVPQPDANGYLLVFMAWLSCATSAVGIKSVSDHVQDSTTP